MGGCIIFKLARLFKRFLPILLAHLSFVYAAAAYAGEGVRFTVRPKLCVLSEGEAHCRDTLELSWYSDDVTSVCLFQNNKTLPLRCWENESRGKHLVSISTDQNIEFQLREIDDRSVLIAEMFEVRHDKPQLRRKKRNPWSIF